MGVSRILIDDHKAKQRPPPEFDPCFGFGNGSDATNLVIFDVMNWFNVIEGSIRYPSGLEWTIWRKLPLMSRAV